MKKSIIALMGLFLITACSEETFDNAATLGPDTGYDQNPEGGTSTSSIDIFLPGSSITGYMTPHYQSPYVLPLSSFQNIEYHFINNTPLSIVIRPSIGLCVYGSWTNGPYNDFLSNPSDYPQLFAGGNRYGNTIELDPIILASGNSLIHGPSTAGLPIGGATLGSGFAYSTSGMTVKELAWMKELGKVHHLSYQVYGEAQDPKGDGIPFTKGILKHQVGYDATTFDLFPSNWIPVTNCAAVPDLYFIYNSEVDRHGELCVANRPGGPIVPSEIDITDPASGSTYKLSFTSDRDNMYIVFQ